MREKSKVIGFRSDIRVTAIESSYTEEDASLVVSLNFNTMNTIISPKSIFDVIFMINGQFSINDITSRNIGHMDIDSKKILDELLDLGIVREYSMDLPSKYIPVNDILENYIVHFPKMTNINVMIAVLLQKLRVRSFFYESGVITQNDVAQNIYYKPNDIGKNIIAFLQNEMKINTVDLFDSPLDIETLKDEKDIVVNSNVTNWVDPENGIVINTWNYLNAHFEDFQLFNGKLDVSDDLKELIDGYVLAVRSTYEMLYSVKEGQFS